MPPILLAEDNLDDEVLLLRTLQSAGIDSPVLPFKDGLSLIAYLHAISHLDGDGHRVLFLDLRMPNMDGYDVLNWLRGRPHFKNLLVIVLSEMDRPYDIQRCYDLGARSFLRKPCGVAQVQELVAAFPQYWT